ncbi:flagellar protein FliT [Aneurinibacillus sp. Ricciae_BoGa-3]|uniref:flagellar protein FliT n=1 Tax=Aneurinibacillus sp. Ricciae_BoGa-3 TaxID=3022697 RepID=UPI0023401D0F|nr:flagellar protein FliT [Aneurinibacillus sp. Ricciae_BoGa-3]WCK54183.1 flagellar protein FliT [Aneurinibacillus sp. Ricciae_BoGa-3]
MTEEWTNQKEKLFVEFKKQTLIQLSAVREEDTWRFSQSVAACAQLIAQINQLEVQDLDGYKNTLQQIGQDIVNMRTEISNLLPAWHEKVRRKMLQEQTSRKVKNVYEEEEYIPPIFMDKRK